MELVRDSNGPTRSGTSWRISAVSLVVLVVLAFSTFGEILGHGFVRWDDDLHITENPLLNPPRWSQLGRFWRESYEDLYIPLSYLFFAGEVSIADGLFPRESDAPPHPLAFKAVSLLLHLTCAWFVWMLVWRWTGNPWGALGGAALFCIHPVQVESVAWTSETRGLLASLLGLGALLLHRPAPLNRSEIGAGRWREILALLLFVGGLLAKPTIVILAPVIVAVDRLVVGLPWRRVVLGSLPWWLAAVAAFLLTRWMQPASSLLFQASLADRLQIACDAVAVHVAHLLWPWPLGIDYGRTPGVAINGGWWLLGLIFLVSAGLAVWRTPSPVRLAVLLFLVGLLPTLGLQPFAFQSISTVADRYAYLAMLGPALAFALIAGVERRTSWTALVVALLLPLLVMTRRQVETWRSDEALFRNAIRVNPRSDIAWNNLGDCLSRAGDSNAAERAFLTAIELNPASPMALYNLGVQAERRGDELLAGRRFEQAATLPHARVQVLLGWARWLERNDRRQEALDWYARALQVSPDHVEAVSEYAGLLIASGSTSIARSLLERAMSLDSRAWQPRVIYGHLLLSGGDRERAAVYYRRALDIRGDLPEPLLNLGLIASQAGQWDAADRQLEEAIDAATQANRTDLVIAATRERTAVLIARGLSSLDSGRLNRAIADLDFACKLDPQSAAAHFHRGRALVAGGDAAGGRAALQTAMGLVPRDSDAAKDIQSILGSIRSGTQ